MNVIPSAVVGSSRSSMSSKRPPGISHLQELTMPGTRDRLAGMRFGRVGRGSAADNASG
jgi:hypothetical protein